MTEQTDKEQTTTPSKKPKKPKGPIRTEVIIPLIIICVGIWAYFHFMFDHNVKSLLEIVGYHAAGAEVNIGQFKTSFSSASMSIKGIQVTNAQKPTHNTLEIGEIRFKLLWDGILRARFIVDEMASEQIGIDIQRKSPGKVKPPPPPPEPKKGPSQLEIEAEKLKNQAVEKMKKEQSENLFGDIASILGGVNGNDQLKNIEDSLPSKKKIKEIEKSYNDKKQKWDDKFKSLPQGKDLQTINDKLAKIKTKDFKDPNELVQSVQQFQALVKEAEEKFKVLQGASKELEDDLKSLESDVKSLEAMIKKDVKDLEARFRIPKIDAKSLSLGLFRKYIDPYIAKFEHYRAIAEKYIPPKYLKKGQKEEKDPEPEFQPHPRAKGVTYEFGRKKSYPLFWVKKINISSKSDGNNSGDLSGKVLNLTSNQSIIDQPTEVKINGNFPSKEMTDVKFDLGVDTRGQVSRIYYDLGIGSYPIEGREVIKSPDVQLSFKKGKSSLNSKGEVKGLTAIDFSINSIIKDLTYHVEAKNNIVDEVLKNVFKGLPSVTINSRIHGDWPGFGIDLDSNLGPELQKGFEKQVQKKIDEAKAQIEKKIQEIIGKEKQKIEGDINKFKAQFEGEIKKAQAQFEQKKKEMETKAQQTQKDTEAEAQRKINEERKKAEDAGKKKLEEEAKKAADELKKKFGL